MQELEMFFGHIANEYSIRNNLKMEFWQLVTFFSKNLTASRSERISIEGYNNSTSIHALGVE